jgi:hypothetical protein
MVLLFWKSPSGYDPIKCISQIKMSLKQKRTNLKYNQEFQDIDNTQLLSKNLFNGII